jgi:hypothetical protein
MGDNGCCVDVGFAAHNENFLKRAPDISVVREGLVIRGELTLTGRATFCVSAAISAAM